ncbi:MAG: PocR ligand-binding domain-containing protein [Halobacteriota archaeon]
MNKMGEPSSLLEFIDLDELQAIQDSFAKTVGISSVIFSPEGEPLTRFSYPTGFCSLIQSTEEGKRRCFQSVKEMSQKAIKLKKPAILYCFAHGGHFVAPIIINDEHKGTMFAGQFIPQSFSPKQLKALEKTAVEINLDPQLLTKEAKEMSVIEEDVVEFYSSLLFQIVEFFGRLGAKAAELNRAQDALQKARDALETHVQERTAELVKSNKQLKREITERKRMEELLRSAEADWRDSFNSLEEVMLIIDRDYNIENINEIGLKLLGKSKEEVIGEKCYQVIHGAENPGEFCPFKETLKTKKVEATDRYEERWGKYFSIKSSPIFDENGEIVKSVDLMRDITERKQAEDELRVAEEKYRTIFETAPISIILFDKDGLIMDVNTWHLTNIAKGKATKADLIGKNIITHPSIVDAGLSETYKGVLEGKEFDKKGVYFPTLIPGTSGYFDVKGVPLFKDGKVIGAVALHDDITERKKAEEELRLFSQAADSSPDGVAMGNFEGRITLTMSY